MDNVLVALWLFFPAGVANASPVFANKIPLLKEWKTPMDFGKKLGGNQILGPNKTWRGFCLAVAVSVIVALIQYGIYQLIGPKTDVLEAIGNVLYSGGYRYLLFGGLIGAGAIIGDAAASFFKRRAGIKPGESWFPFDQIDFILGGFAIGALVIRFTFESYLIIFSVWFFVHLLVVFVGYKIGLRKKPI